MRSPLVFAALLALSACASSIGGLGGLSLIGGYRLLSMPSAELPVGAAWRKDDGPIGKGADLDNIIQERSFSTVALSRESERSLKLGLARFLDLKPSMEGMIAASVADVTIHSVENPSLLGFEPDQLYLHSAMKAGRITVTVESSYSMHLVAGLRAHGLDPSIEAGQSGRRRISVEGADLFFAYRLRRFEQD